MLAENPTLYRAANGATADLRSLFLLDPTVVFLNHGSFGATPRPVFETYQQLQLRLERQPVQFLGREIGDHLAAARQALGRYLQSDPADLVFVPNATFAVNIVARSLELGPDDEVLTTNHEYGACSNVWRFLGRQQGFRYVEQPIDLPLSSAADMVEQFWQGVTPRTKVIYISHITSPTALCFPVEAICARAREAGILTVIDGAHAPGQIDLDLPAIGADFYCGNCHKWLSSPKGAGFLYTRRERQHLIEPLVIGWGWGEGRTLTFGSDYLDYLQWLGTNDLSAYLSVPAAIEFQQTHEWAAVRQQCHLLLRQGIERIAALTRLATVYPLNGDAFFHQMAIAPLPHLGDLQGFKDQFYDQFRVEVPFVQWDGRHFIRVSVQGYNTQEDIDALLSALAASLPA